MSEQSIIEFVREMIDRWGSREGFHIQMTRAQMDPYAVRYLTLAQELASQRQFSTGPAFDFGIAFVVLRQAFYQSMRAYTFAANLDTQEAYQTALERIDQWRTNVDDACRWLFRNCASEATEEALDSLREMWNNIFLGIVVPRIERRLQVGFPAPGMRRQEYASLDMTQMNDFVEAQRGDWVRDLYQYLRTNFGTPRDSVAYTMQLPYNGPDNDYVTWRNRARRFLGNGFHNVIRGMSADENIQSEAGFDVLSKVDLISGWIKMCFAAALDEYAATVQNPGSALIRRQTGDWDALDPRELAYIREQLVECIDWAKNYYEWVIGEQNAPSQMLDQIVQLWDRNFEQAHLPWGFASASGLFTGTDRVAAYDASGLFTGIAADRPRWSTGLDSVRAMDGGYHARGHFRRSRRHC